MDYCQTKVKICGVRRDEDIVYANTHLPDYVGFVFAQSRRRVSPEQAYALSNELNDSIKRAGIFVNESIDRVIDTAVKCRLDVLQIHGDEGPEYVKTLKAKLGRNRKIEIWKALRIKDRDSVSRIKDYDADAFVLDAYVEGVYGGAGKTFDWNLAVEAKKYGRIVLAGGLNLENVRKAVNIVHPFTVDISSGVETEGCKDERKIKDFIYSVRCNMY